MILNYKTLFSAHLFSGYAQLHFIHSRQVYTESAASTELQVIDEVQYIKWGWTEVGSPSLPAGRQGSPNPLKKMCLRRVL